MKNSVLTSSRSVSCPPYLESEDAISSQTWSFQKTAESEPFLFTQEAKKAFLELRKDADGSKAQQRKQNQKMSRRPGGASQPLDSMSSKGPKDHTQTSFPPITMLLKPKDQSKVKLSTMRQRQPNQADLTKVTDATISEQSLKVALKKLRQASVDMGLNLNTKTLWRQSSFLPPSTEKRSTVVAHRAREFDEWREEAWRTWHRSSMTAPATLITSAADPATIEAGLSMSPRGLTEQEAESLLEHARVRAMTLERQMNDARHTRRETERELEKLRGELRHQERLRAEARVEDSSTALSSRLQKAKEGLDEMEVKLRRESKVRLQREFLKARLAAMVGEDERDLEAIRREAKLHTHDLEALRQRVNDEAPKMERGLLANEIKEAQFVLDSVRSKYTRELQIRRAAVVENERIKQEMITSDARYKAMEEELLKLYDPNANTPRRTEMRNKLVSYEQAFKMMFRRLGDTDIDRLVTLFLSTRSNRTTWEEAVRDAEARSEELRRERDRLVQCLARSKSAGSRDGTRGQTAAEVERRIRDLQDKVKATSRYQMGKQKHDNLLQLISSFYQGVQASVTKMSSLGVSTMPVEPPIDLIEQVVDLTRIWGESLMNLVATLDASRGGKDALRRASVRPSGSSRGLSTGRRLSGVLPPPESSPLSRGSGRDRKDILEPPPEETEAEASGAKEVEADAAEEVKDENDNTVSETKPQRPAGENKKSNARRRVSTWFGGMEQVSSNEGSSDSDDSRSESEAAPSPDGEPLHDAPPVLEDRSEPPVEAETNRRRAKWILVNDKAGGPKWTLKTRIDPGLGMLDEGLFPREVVLKTMQDNMWPNRPTQLRIRIPKRLRREDKRLGQLYAPADPQESEDEYSSGSQKSFDYDEVVEEFEDMYSERDKMKKRSAKAGALYAAKKKEEED